MGGAIVIYGDGPTLEEAALWADLAEVAAERDAALFVLRLLLAENARLQSLLTDAHALAA
jgi:hypothetical protein